MVYGVLLVVTFAGVAFATAAAREHLFHFKHHNNDELLQVLDDVNAKCPNITRIYALSETSVLGTPLYLIEFSTKPGHHEISKYGHNYSIYFWTP